MKKLFVIIGALLVLASVSYVYAKSAPKNLEAAVKEAAERKERVERMCQEWPGCKEWVAARGAQQHFSLVDAEAEYQVAPDSKKEMKKQITHGNKNEVAWEHRFYLQTIEGNKVKAYRFERVKKERNDIHYNIPGLLKESHGYFYLKPKEIKKFPGHPIKEQPSEHAYYPTSIVSNDSLAKCQKWDKCKELLKKKRTAVSRAVEEQYVHFDENNNALWRRSLYVQLFYYSGGGDSFAFYAEQKEVGGPYIYHDPQRINQCPNHPDFTR